VTFYLYKILKDWCFIQRPALYLCPINIGETGWFGKADVWNPLSPAIY